jgi:hypothetical protein
MYVLYRGGCSSRCTLAADKDLEIVIDTAVCTSPFGHTPARHINKLTSPHDWLYTDYWAEYLRSRYLVGNSLARRSKTNTSAPLPA